MPASGVDLDPPIPPAAAPTPELKSHESANSPALPAVARPRPRRSLPSSSILYALHRAHFDWTTFFAQLRRVHLVPRRRRRSPSFTPPTGFAPGAGPSSAAPRKHVRPHRSPRPPSFVGFTAVAPLRPPCRSRPPPTSSPVALACRWRIPGRRPIPWNASSISALPPLSSPPPSPSPPPASLPPREASSRFGVGSLAATLTARCLRRPPSASAESTSPPTPARLLSRLSPKLGAGLAPAVQTKILGFRDGLRAISTLARVPPRRPPSRSPCGA